MHIPLYSLFSKDLYKDVCFRWTGINLLYLLLLLALCWIPPMISFQISLVDMIDNYLPEIVSQVPECRIVNGRASVDEPQPYHIYDLESGSIFVTIDTTGKIDNLENSDAQLLLTETHLIYRESDFETKTYSLANIDHYTLNQSVIYGWLNFAKGFISLISYPFIVIGSLIGRTFQLLIYTLIAMIFAHILSTKREFKDLYRLAVVAITPSIILKTIFRTFNVSIPGILYALVTLAFLFFGVHAVSKEINANSDESIKLS